MKSILSFAIALTIASVNGGLLHGTNFTPNLVATRTIVGGAVGGASSAGAFSAAHYTQTVAAPGTIHTIVSTQPVHHYGYSGSLSNSNNNNQHASIAPRGSNGGTLVADYGTYGYDVHSEQGVNSGRQQHQSYSQANSYQQLHNYQ